MKKKLVFATLVLGIGLVSCQKDKIDSDGDRLVDVVTSITTSEMIPSKTEVTSNGATNWCITDKVYIVDKANRNPFETGTTAREFTNNLTTSSYTSGFKGTLLAGLGSYDYYAYHSAKNSPCTLNGYNLTVSRNDLAILCDDNLDANKQGEYCSMVAVPLKFDAEDANSSKKFEFHHVSSLIEARITATNGLKELEFDKVVFTLTAIDPTPEFPAYNDLSPFNKTITINMKDIAGPPNVSIPYSEGSEKKNSISSTITYSNIVTFAQRYTSTTGHFDIPIYALPTTAKFTYQSDIIFYNGKEIKYHLRKRGIADGLKLSGLNTPSFNETNLCADF